MGRQAFLDAVRILTLGKRLPDGVYLHSSLVPQLPEALRSAVADAEQLVAPGFAYEVVRLSPKSYRLSFLHYPGFFEEPFPALAQSWVVDLGVRSVATRTYELGRNPPILHRKELLLAPKHPRRDEFAALTAMAENAGLFAEAKEIGTKRAWEARLSRLRLRVDGHRLVDLVASNASDSGADGEAAVERHRTALHRYSLSAPVQALWRHGLIGGSSVFDYGCGRGDDLRILRELGVDAAGWDPHFAPTESKREAEVVNLGYVINVIEEPRERAEALRGAYSLARRVLAVSALIGGRTAFEQHRLFRDGVLTTRGTFQKYFTQQELRGYIEEVLGREPVAVAPGLFFVFRRDEDEQQFLATRQMQGRCDVSLPRPDRPAPLPRASKWEQHAPLLDAFWECSLGLGRIPKDHEFAQMPELRGSLGTPQTVLRRLVSDRGADSLDAARRSRMDDLLVYLALNLFERRKSFTRLPPKLQNDIAGFWGNYAAAKGLATDLLFSIGKPDVIDRACRAASAAGIGYLDGDHNLQLKTSLVQRLPPPLRVYVGAASRLYGEVESADLVKIHIRSGKLTLLIYDDFSGRPLPRLVERIKVDMRAQEVIFFEYGDELPKQLLYEKARFLPSDDPDLERQRAFDAQLRSLPIDISGFGPDEESLLRILAERHSLRIDGFALRSRGNAQR